MITDGCTSLPASPEQLRQELELARRVNEQLIDQLKNVQRENAQLEHQLQQLLGRLYGRSAEKIDPNQQVLFADLLQQLQSQQQQTPAPVPIEPAAPKPTGNNGHGRRRLPADLPRETKVIDLSEDQKPSRSTAWSGSSTATTSTSAARRCATGWRPVPMPCVRFTI